MSEEMIKDIDTTPDVQMQDVIRDADERAPRAKGKTFFRKKVCRFCVALPQSVERFFLAALLVPVQSTSAAWLWKSSVHVQSACFLS